MKTTKPTFSEQLTILYAILLLGGLPLIYHNGYTDLLQTKQTYFFLITGVFFVLLLLSKAIKYITYGTQGTKQSLTPSEYFALSFLCTAILSWVINADKHNALFGIYGRRVGLLVLIACMIIYLILPRILGYHQIIMSTVLLAGAVVAFVGILNQIGYDPLSMFQGMDNTWARSSTIGNHNTFAAYLSIMAAVQMACFVISKEKLSKWIYGSSAFLTFAGCFAGNSDSVLAVLFVIFIVLVCKSIVTSEELAQTGIVVILLGTATLCFKLLRYLRGAACPELSGLIKQFIEGPAPYLCILAGILLLVIAKEMEKRKIGQETKQRIRNYTVIAIVMTVVCLAAAIAFITLTMTKQEAKEHFGWLARYVYIDETWGTNRIRIWRVSIQTYLQMPFINKLFGYGPAGFYRAVSELMPQAAYSSSAGTIMDAHNEVLQYLVSLGVVGVISYYGILVSAWRECRRRAKENNGAMVTEMILVAFFIQGLVNNPHIIVTTLVFFLIAWKIE